MGYYINPKGETKEEWLRREGREVPETEPLMLKDFVVSDELPVCWVDNGHFTAAAVAYSKGEVRAFQVLGDTRPKIWFMVTKSKLDKSVGLDPKLLEKLVRDTAKWGAHQGKGPAV